MAASLGDIPYLLCIYKNNRSVHINPFEISSMSYEFQPKFQENGSLRPIIA